MRAGAAGLRAALPLLLPRGVRPELGELLGLRRHGATMRRLLALDAESREGRPAAASRRQGMDYAESRPYTPSDDVRRIDWRVTARTGRAHTKVFRLERGSDLYCIVDQRASMRFGTRAAFKSVVAAQLAVLAGWAAAAGGDRFGALVAGARTSHVAIVANVANIGMDAAEASAAALCSALVGDAPDAAGSDGDALDQLASRAASATSPGTRFVVVSGFADPDAVLERAVKILRARGELDLFWVLDPLEAELPPPASYPLTDGREHLVLDTASHGVREAHARAFEARRVRFARYAAQPGIRCRVVRTGEDLFEALGRPLARETLR